MAQVAFHGISHRCPDPSRERAERDDGARRQNDREHCELQYSQNTAMANRGLRSVCNDARAICPYLSVSNCFDARPGEVRPAHEPHLMLATTAAG